MLVANIIGTVVFYLSLLAAVFIIFCGLLKIFGVTYFGLENMLFFIIAPCIFFALEQAVFYYNDNAWWASLIFIAMNLGVLVVEYFLLVNAGVFCKNSLYRLTRYMVFKKYSYGDVIGYKMKLTAGTVVRRFGQKVVKTYDVEIYLSDNTHISFSTKHERNRKIEYIKSLLEANRCHRNGRIKRQKCKW